MQRLVEAHKGTVSIESRPGEGTKVVLTLRAVLQELRRNVPKIECLAVLHPQVEHLVEVAIV